MESTTKTLSNMWNGWKHGIYIYIGNGMSSSQLTFTPWFFRGVGGSTTNQWRSLLRTFSYPWCFPCTAHRYSQEEGWVQPWISEPLGCISGCFIMNTWVRRWILWLNGSWFWRSYLYVPTHWKWIEFFFQCLFPSSPCFFHKNYWRIYIYIILYTYIRININVYIYIIYLVSALVYCSISMLQDLPWRSWSSPCLCATGGS